MKYLITAILFLPATVSATCYKCTPPEPVDPCCQAVEVNNYVTVESTAGTNGTDGVDGQDGTTAEQILQDDSFSSTMASMAAMANIPAIPHQNEHGHTGVGVGVGAYNNKLAMGVGLIHHYEDVSLKATISKAYSQEAIYGAGATFGF